MTTHLGFGSFQVEINGTWGGICDDSFTINEANVICRQMGFELGARQVWTLTQFYSVFHFVIKIGPGGQISKPLTCFDLGPLKGGTTMTIFAMPHFVTGKNEFRKKCTNFLKAPIPP